MKLIENMTLPELEHALVLEMAAHAGIVKRDGADFRIHALNKAIAYIRSEPEMSQMTAAQIKAAKRQKALDAAPALKWERKGSGYTCGNAYVQKIDADFVIIEIAGKRLDCWYRTVKEAKAVAAILISKQKGGALP